MAGFGFCDRHDEGMTKTNDIDIAAGDGWTDATSKGIGGERAIWVGVKDEGGGETNEAKKKYTHE